LIAAVEHAAVGVVGEVNILNLELGRKFLAIDDYAEAVDFVVATQADMNERTAHLAPAVFGGAGSDPELAQYRTDLIAGVNSQIRRILDVYRDRGWLRGDVPFDEIVQTVSILGSVETYLRIVHIDGWSIAAYRAWLRRMVDETVFVPPQPD
jgi:hypothetical protein